MSTAESKGIMNRINKLNSRLKKEVKRDMKTIVGMNRVLLLM